MKYKSIDIMKKVFYYMIPIAFLLITLVTISSNPIWKDEAFSLTLVKYNFADIIKLDSLDVHPPLYYLILRLFVIFLGKYINEVVLGKIVSVIPYIIIVIIGFTYVRKEYGILESFLFNILVLGMPQMLTYAVEIRMYSLGMLFVFCAFLQLLKILSDGCEKRNDYILLTIFSTSAAYTHYFACISCIVIYFELLLCFFVRRRFNCIIKTIISGIGVVVFYIPWLMFFFRQLATVRNDYWIEELNISTLIDIILFLIDHKKIPFKILLLVFCVAVVSSLVLAVKEKRIEALCGIGVWFGTFLIGVILSYAIRPIFVARYLMCSAACLWFGTALAISRIYFMKIKGYYFVPVIVLIGILVSGKFWLYENWFNRTSADTRKELDRHITENTIIVTDSTSLQQIMAYFYPENEILSLEDTSDEVMLQIFGNTKMKNLYSMNDLQQYYYGDADLLILDENQIIHSEMNKNGFLLKHISELQYDYYNFDAYFIN